MEVKGSLDSLVKLLACQHFIENITCTENIAFLVVSFLIALVDLLDVHLWGRIDRCAAFKGNIAFLDLSGNTEICDFEVTN